MRRFPTWQELFQGNRITSEALLLGVAASGTLLLIILGSVPGIQAEFAFQESLFGSEPTGDVAFAILSLVLLGLLLAVSWGGFGSQGIWVALLLVAALGMVNLRWETIQPTLSIPALTPAGLLPGCWILLAILAAAFLADWNGRRSRFSLYGVGTLALALPFLGSIHAADSLTGASALRWIFLLVGLLFGVAGAVHRDSLRSRSVAEEGDPADRSFTVPMVQWMTAAGLIVALLPQSLFTLRFLHSLQDGILLVGPAESSLFGSLGATLSHALPFGLLAGVLLLLAWRKSQPEFTLAASFAVNALVSIVLLVPFWLKGRHAEVYWETLIHWNALAFSVWLLGWILLRSLYGKSSLREFLRFRPPTPHAVQLLLPVTLLGLVYSLVTGEIIVSPEKLPALVEHSASLVAWLALGITLLSLFSFLRSTSFMVLVPVVSVVVLTIISAVAGGVYRWNTESNWLSYHVLSAGWGSWALLLSLAHVWFYGKESNEVSSESKFLRVKSTIFIWALALTAGIVFLAVRAYAVDPLSPRWSVGLLLCGAVVTTLLAVPRRQQGLAWVSAVLSVVAVTAWECEPHLTGAALPAQFFARLIEVNIAGLIAFGFVWLGIEVYFQRKRNQVFDPDGHFPSVHHLSAGLGLLGFAGLAVVCILTRLISPTPWEAIELSNLPGWLVLAFLELFLLASLWDRTARHVVPGCYLWGLLLAATVIDHLELTGDGLAIIAAAGLGGFVLATGFLWRCLPKFQLWLSPIGIVPDLLDSQRAWKWMSVTNILLTGVVVLLGFWGVENLTDLQSRGFTSLGIALALPGLGLLVRRGELRFVQATVLLGGILLLIQGCWVFMPPDLPLLVLRRTISIMLVFAGIAIAYGLGSRSKSQWMQVWTQPLEEFARWCGIGTVGVLFVVLGMEGAHFKTGIGVPLADWEVIVVALGLVSLVGTLLVWAIWPDRDPKVRSEKFREGYVYFSELLLVLIGLHIYLARPMWFGGYLLPYWPYLTMAIAFVGAGVGEVLNRYRLTVLANPLQRTGAFLPLLPAIGFWVMASRLEPDSAWRMYSGLLFLIGVLYVLLSMWRESFVYGLLAALTGNAGLWALLLSEGFSLATQPQLWLIPPALSVLIAAQLNRARLSTAQLNSLRYLCVMVIYVSSTGEMFMKGIGENIWLPMILATLSVIGVMAGMLLRVRAFLYLGSTFLLISIVGMVGHAARSLETTWPWWVFGICLGIGLLVLFGIFEKKRDEMNELLGKLQRWE